MRKNEKGFGIAEALLVLVILALVGFLAWWVYKQNSRQTPTQEENTQATAEPQASAVQEGCVETDGYSVYTNTDIGFCFLYPTEWGSVTLEEGIIDASQEAGQGYRGNFGEEPNASFALRTSDWAYNGPIRDGSAHAVGFNTYESFEFGDTTPHVIRTNTDTSQLVAYSTDFNFKGAVVVAKKPFADTGNYAGIEFNFNVEGGDDFDAMTDSPSEIVNDERFTQLDTILSSVKEL